MAEYTSCIMTELGRKLIAKAIAGTATIQFTKMCTSAASYTESQAKALTSLNDIKQTELISTGAKLNDTSVSVKAVFTNEKVETMYFIRTIGVYAKDSQGQEILYAVFLGISPEEMPDYNGSYPQNVIFNVVLTVGNADNAVIKIDGAAVATQDDIKEINKKLTAYLSVEADGVYINYEEVNK